MSKPFRDHNPDEDHYLPYQLILERWNDLYNKRGAPYIYRFVCPTMDLNIWQLLDMFLTLEEKNWINDWMTRKPSGDVLLIGNYVHLLPFVIGGSRLLDYFTPVDLPDHFAVALGQALPGPDRTISFIQKTMSAGPGI